MTERGRDEERREEEGRLTQPFAAARWRRWRGIAIACVIVIVGLLSLAGLQRLPDSGSRFAVVEHEAEPATVPTDPLTAELIRCGALPPQVDAPACRTAWDENRRRFFGETRAARGPGEPLPTYAPNPAPGTMPVTMER